MKSELQYGIVASSKTRVRCIFCGVHIPKAKKCIEQHTNGVKHKETIELMSENGINCVNGVLHCRPCQQALSEQESVLDHCFEDTHSTWMMAMEDLLEDEFINSKGYLAYERDDVFCEVCNMPINCTLQNIQEHVGLISHQSNTVEKLKPLNGIFRVDNDHEVWCKLCDAYVENTVQGILDHIDDENHQRWFTEVLDLIEDQDVSIDDYLANEHELHAFCSKCQIQVPCNVEKLEEHVYSDSHLNQFS